MYEKESKQEEERLQKMKDDGKDEHDIKKQVSKLTAVFIYMGSWVVIRR